MEKVLEVTINSIGVGVINENVYKDIVKDCKKSKLLKAKQIFIFCNLIYRLFGKIASNTAICWVWLVGIFCVVYRMEIGFSVVTEKSLIDVIGITFTISLMWGIFSVMIAKMFNGAQDVEEVVKNEINNRVRLAIGCSTVGEMEILNVYQS